jgi:hypothetical protein
MQLVLVHGNTIFNFRHASAASAQLSGNALIFLEIDTCSTARCAQLTEQMRTKCSFLYRRNQIGWHCVEDGHKQRNGEDECDPVMPSVAAAARSRT